MMLETGLVYSIEGGKGERADQVFRHTLEEVMLAETLGFDSVFLSEHHFVENGFFPSPLIALSYLAAKSMRIKIGPGVLLLPLYDPIHVAEDCAVLDIISGGRLILGVGQGYRPEEFQAFGRELRDRPALVREGVTLIRRLWTEPSVSFHGKYFHAENLPLRPQPIQRPAPPIWVAAKKRRAVRVGGRGRRRVVRRPDHAPCRSSGPIALTGNRRCARAGGDPVRKSFAYYREFFVAENDATAWRIGVSQ